MTRGRDLPPGIARRHARSCPAYRTDDMQVCTCRPSYQAQAGPRRARQTRTWPTLTAAKGWKRDVELAAERGELDGHAPTVQEAAERWLAKAESGAVMARGEKRYRPSTLRTYRHWMEQELYPVLGTVKLNRLTRGRVNELVQGLQQRGLAPQTVKNVVIPLRAVYRDALDLELVAGNPTKGARVPAGSGRRMRVLAPDEIPGTLAALAGGDRALWATAIYAGLRRGELMALRWADVDLAAGMITVRFSYDPTGQRMGEVKSDAGQDRKVPITAALRDHLTEHRSRSRAGGLVFCRSSLAGVCRTAMADRPFADATVSKRAGNAWTRARVRPVSLHDCRHTFASLMIAATAAGGTFNPKVIQQMLGHSTIGQTYDRYGHLFPGADLEAARQLDAFLELEINPNSKVLAAAGRLVAAIDDTPADVARPAVSDLADQLQSWLAEHPALPTVTDGTITIHERAVSVQRTYPGEDA